METKKKGKVKATEEIVVTILDPEARNYYTQQKSTIDVVIEKGKKLEPLGTVTDANGVESWKIDGAEFGFPGIILTVPIVKTKPVTNWQLYIVIAAVLVLVAWYVKVSVQNNSFNPLK